MDAVRVRDLTHRFGDGETAKPVLHGLDLRVGAGEVVLLTGPSGSGKTTLLTLIGGLRAVQEGSCVVLGTELAGADEAARVAVRRRIGFIFQHHNLLGFLTAQQNVAMALEVDPRLGETERLARAEAMLDAVGIGEKARAYPATLSGGQRQRVAIARALVHGPGLILADEPTAALDGRTGGETMRLLQRLAKEQRRTVFIVTHDPRIHDIADRIVAMEDGRIIEAAHAEFSEGEGRKALSPTPRAIAYARRIPLSPPLAGGRGKTVADASALPTPSPLTFLAACGHTSTMSTPHWHAMPAEEVRTRLRTGPDGLDQAEAEARLAEHGPNRLPAAARRGPLRRFLAQFQSVLIHVLLGAAVATALLERWKDTVVIVAVVVINAIVGFIQEGKAEQAMEAVRRMLSPRATVIRNGHRHGIDVEEIVPGDLVVLEPGDRVPADLRIVSARGLTIQEAILTGESLPVAKSAETVDDRAALGDRSSMAFSGTVVAAGHGRGVVIATGAATEIGRISDMLAEVEQLQTPLLRAIAQFGKALSVAILLLAAATFAFGYGLRGLPAHEMFLAAVSIAVASIPEGLPAVITIILALGVRRMAARNAIVRRLPAVEALGSVDIICTDKTGTLTHNELSVRVLALPDGEIEVAGVGYVPEGDLTRDGSVVAAEEDAALAALLRAAVLCNDARLHRDGGEWTIAGDPTDGAFLVAAEKAGLDAEVLRRRWSRTDAIPFESDHKFMATLHHDHEGHGLIAVKGAPEVLIARCRDVGATWQQRLEALAGRGFRLIAAAARPTEADHRSLEFDDIRDLDLLGVAALIDAAREEAIAAVAECRRAGIAVTMITGDHAGTALAVGREVGLDVSAGALTGAELDAIDDRALIGAAERVRVFARTTPAHKLRLVQALQARRHVVAMTGDGVNDAPALKRADIGVAMGRAGTEAAKEAAEIVLADDNFATIAAAVREGRTVYDNLKKTLLFILPTNGGQAMTVVAAVLLGLSVLPVAPLQILWVNLVVAVTLALALAFEPAEPDLMRRPPRMPDEPILSALLLWRIGLVSVLLAAATITAFVVEYAAGKPVENARGAAVTALIAGQVAYLFNARFFRRSSLSLDTVTGNPAVPTTIGLIVLLHGLFLYAPPMQVWFGVAPPDLSGWLFALAAAVIVFGVVEIEKALMRRAPATPSGRRPPAEESP